MKIIGFKLNELEKVGLVMIGLVIIGMQLIELERIRLNWKGLNYIGQSGLRYRQTPCLVGVARFYHGSCHLVLIL